VGRRRSAEERTSPWGTHGSWRARRFYADSFRIEILWRPNVPRVLTDASLARTVTKALRAAGAPERASVAVVLADDAELAELNHKHMGHEGPTDVLSFPMLPPGSFGHPHDGRGDGPAVDPARFVPPRSRLRLGDLVISVERAIEQAEQGRGGQTGDVRWSPADELRLLVTHGTLHICGWDHAEPEEEARMRALEQRLLGT
jgi:probable rRNA maturation factor